MVAGLLSGISDPVFMKRIDEQNRERNRIIDRIAQQMACSREVAKMNLSIFEAATSSDGQVLN
jgi:hypothetical protein